MSGVAFMVMWHAGHFQRMRPLISGLAARGVPVHVFGDRRFKADAERDDARFVDLFAKYPLESADGKSMPLPCRSVSFAGHYAEAVASELEALGTSLVVYDTFAVIGRVAGHLLDVPYVNVCAGHNVTPARLPSLIPTFPEAAISPRCERAVELLRTRYGMPDASPFSFATALSPHLNVYGEPAAYLADADREAFEPVAFWGSLPSLEQIESRRRAAGPSYFGGDEAALRIYVSLGAITWVYWVDEGLAALASLSDALAGLPGVSAVISLGGAELEGRRVDALSRPNVAVKRHVDQWHILEEADVFVTHNGLSSTHEAIFSEVPMISYPWFWDQPALAEKCRSLGLAVPLTDSPREPVRASDLRAALAQIAGNKDSYDASLAAASAWEREAIADRDAVLARIVDLV